MATLVAKTVDPGGTGQYTSMSAAEAASWGASNANLTVSDEYCVTTLICTNGAADTTPCNFGGVTTDGTRNVLVQTDLAYFVPGAVPSSGNFYRMNLTGAAGLYGNNANVTINRLSIQHTADANTNYAVQCVIGPTWYKNITIKFVPGSYTTHRGLSLVPASGTAYAWNCLVYGCTGANSRGMTGATGTAYFSNCTSVGNTAGFNRSSGTIVVRNGVATGCTTSITGALSTGSRNIVCDAAAPGATGTTITTGTTTSATAGKLNDTGKNFVTLGVRVGTILKNTTDTTYTYVTAVDSATVLSVNDDIFANGEAYSVYYNLVGAPTFFNSGAGNYHLVAGASNIAYQTGVDLDSDGDTPVTDDVDGQARHATTPCIGFDESAIYDVACAEGIAFGDSSAKTMATSQSATDGVKFGDSSAKTMATSQSATDGVKFGDSSAGLSARYASAADGISFGETLDVSIDVGGTFVAADVAEGVVLGDSVSRVMATAQASADGMKFGDSTTRVVETVQAAADGLALGDSLMGYVPYSEAASDGVKFSDTVSMTSSVSAEFVWTIDPNGTGQYTSQSAWEAGGLGIDFTSATVKVFSHGGITGGLSVGTAVTGVTSGATGIVHGITTSQILLRAISGTFQPEKIQKTGDVTKYVNTSNAGSPVVCKARLICTNGSADTTRVSYSGTTTSPTNYVLIETEIAYYSPGAVPSSGNFYRLDTTYPWGMFIDDENITINRLSMRHTASADTCYAIQCVRGPTRLKKVVVEFVPLTYTTGRGISFVHVTAGESAYASNCIVYGCTGANSRAFTTASTTTAYFSNCVAVGNDTGFNITSGTAVLKNCISVENVTDYAGTANAASTHNGYSTAALTGDVAPINLGTNETLTFVNYAAKDFHVKALATCLAYQTGADLDADPNLPVTDDITGRARHSTTPCLGAFEAVSLPAIATEGVKLTDTPSNLAARLAAASDGVKWTDTPTRVSATVQAAADGFKASDSTVGYSTQVSDAAVDGVKLSDSTAAIRLDVGVVAEGITLSDSSACNLITFKAGIDGVKFSDSTAKTAVRRPATADGIKFSDTPTKTAARVAATADGVKLSDSAVGTSVRPQTVAEGLTLTDSTANTAARVAAASEGVTLSDSATWLVTSNDTADGVVFGDSPTATITTTQAASDGVKVGDSTAATKTVVVPISNVITDEGIAKLLDGLLCNVAPVTNWYVGLASATPVTAGGHTLADHEGWSEVVSYSESVRQAYAAVRGGGTAVSNSASKAAFSVNGTVSIGGAFLCSDPTKSGTDGSLLCVAGFVGGDRDFEAGDSIVLEYDLAVTYAP